MLLKNILTLAFIAATMLPAIADPIPGPYKDDTANTIYQMLFCDQPSLFQQTAADSSQEPWATLFHNPPDHAALAKIAQDPKAESRVRSLAFNALRAADKPLPGKILLGAIIEVALDQGIDTLAVFTDGSARYIHQSGRMAVIENFDTSRNEIETVIATAKPIVAAIPPYRGERKPPPRKGNIRTTILSSDGLHPGEGPFDLMQKDRDVGPLIRAATALLLQLVDKTTAPPTKVAP